MNPKQNHNRLQKMLASTMQFSRYGRNQPGPLPSGKTADPDRSRGPRARDAPAQRGHPGLFPQDPTACSPSHRTRQPVPARRTRPY
jgi:hypothetical protein